MSSTPYFLRFAHDLSQLPFRTMEWKYTCLSLYRQILKQHTKKLVPQQRFLGDAYVKQEFKLNKTGDEQYARPFVEEWIQYYKILAEAESPGDIGQEFPHEEYETMSKEQQEQFLKLKEETEKVREYLKEVAKPDWQSVTIEKN
ncbi:hypothetical protein FDP41_000141 [Naegleria fowleri]|uniref:Succinate dehydrogenase assembly factor 3 n=1 Tax=Naegleria fowleri TaxID=5763 RepID=A0A6A5CDD6_NAEFO|nr:uncharacterized protein FDP41_000141 [Naegleria fowleri]KAF0985102.1 hypothetical protein FDP41_000141 [Naegleria fowleri]CAG4711327.1 unnamed protein product [Naegleria fowleri]